MRVCLATPSPKPWSIRSHLDLLVADSGFSCIVCAVERVVIHEVPRLSFELVLPYITRNNTSYITPYMIPSLWSLDCSSYRI